MSLRTAQVMLGRGFGGAERSFVDLCHALARRGHAVLAVCDPRGRAIASLDGASGVELAPVVCRGAWDRWAGHHIRRALATFHPGVVHTHLARAAHLGGRAARRLSLPTVAKTHNLVDLKYYSDIDCLVPTTREQERYLLAHGVRPQAIERIPNFSALTPRPVRASDTPPRRVKALGRFVAKKGFDLLIDALAAPALAALELELAGDGPERASLMARARAAGVDERVSFTGWVDDVGTFLADAELFVLPSRDEPFGIVILEAMAAGVPVVTTPTAGPSEILDEETAYFAADATVEALVAAVERACRDAGRSERAAAAQRLFTTRYSEDVVVQRYLELYARLRARAFTA
ncbi:MAG: glycosyltransferase family 4 protein [Gammaproteobacteria bacterium]